MRGRVDSEPEAVNPMPHGKRKFLSIGGGIKAWLDQSGKKGN
jgi:hypothetical protein